MKRIYSKTCRQCGALFTSTWGPARFCPPCGAMRTEARIKASRRAYQRRNYSSPFRAPCTACGLRLVYTHGGETRCSECREKRARLRRSLARVGMEIQQVRIISGGGGPGTGKDRR